jgi:pyrrolidone-carboxylate peptidase
MLPGLAVLNAVLAASPRVLLTGFTSFDHKTDNPSGDVAKALNGTCAGGVCFESLLLSVDSSGASSVASLLAQSNTSRWDAIVQLGEDLPAQFMHVNYAHIELVAANVRSHSDGNDDDLLVDGAQDFLPATVDAARLTEIANRSNVIWHRDAGHYFCNEAFFRTTYAIRAANITAPGAAARRPGGSPALLPSLLVHLPPPKVMSVAEGQALVTAIAAAIAVPPAWPANAARKVLLGGFGDRLGPDRGGAAALKLNGTLSAGGFEYEALIAGSDDPGAVAHAIRAAVTKKGALPWAGVLLVAEQQDRMQQGFALQAVGYTHNGATDGGARGDEEDTVLPATADLARLNPLVRPAYKADDAALVWTRDNAEIGASGAAYYQTLLALRDATAGAGAPPALLASLPFDDERAAADDAKLIDQLVARMLG